MLVPFGTRVVDKNGKGVGTVSRVVLRSGSRQASGLLVHQGVLDRRPIVLPIAKAGGRITLGASTDEMKKLEGAPEAPDPRPAGVPVQSW